MTIYEKVCKTFYNNPSLSKILVVVAVRYLIPLPFVLLGIVILVRNRYCDLLVFAKSFKLIFFKIEFDFILLLVARILFFVCGFSGLAF